MASYSPESAEVIAARCHRASWIDRVVVVDVHAGIVPTATGKRTRQEKAQFVVIGLFQLRKIATLRERGELIGGKCHTMIPAGIITIVARNSTCGWAR